MRRLLLGAVLVAVGGVAVAIVAIQGPGVSLAWRLTSQVRADGKTNSCPKPGFCGRLEGTSTLAFVTPEHPTHPRPAYVRQGPVEQVSCPTITFCGATASSDAYMYSDGSWSKGERVDDDGSLLSITCPSSGFCVAVDGRYYQTHQDGYAYVYSNHRWSDGRVVDAEGLLLGVSCSSRTSCEAVGENGEAFSYRHGEWGRGVMVNRSHLTHALTSVSCPVETFCMAIGNDQHSYLDESGEWHVGPTVTSDDVFFDFVSCHSSTTCVAQLQNGRTFLYRPVSRTVGSQS